MDSSRAGIVDIGSNTFHLLVCDLTDGQFAEVYRQRIFVALAEGGIKTIRPAALTRAKTALLEIADSLTTYDVTRLRIVGTAAMRSADNAYIIKDMVQETLGHPLEVIDGSREAELIYKGITLLPGVSRGSHLIMDIGGGSTEFIIVEEGQLAWSQSFDIGVGVLHELFHKSEPIAPTEIEELGRFLDKELRPLRAALQRSPITSLIGASGSFEVLASIQGQQPSKRKLMTFTTDQFAKVEHRIINSDHATRERIEGLPNSRVKLIVVAFVLLRYIIDMADITAISVSPYALKEGLISELQSS